MSRTVLLRHCLSASSQRWYLRIGVEQNVVSWLSGDRPSRRSWFSGGVETCERLEVRTFFSISKLVSAFTLHRPKPGDRAKEWPGENAPRYGEEGRNQIAMEGWAQSSGNESVYTKEVGVLPRAVSVVECIHFQY